MKFNSEYKTIIESLNKEEARAYILFLITVMIRHQEGIIEAWALIQKVKERFEI